MIEECEEWENEYRTSRYMHHLDRDELIVRLRDIVCNLEAMNRAGLTHLKFLDSDTKYFLMLWCHMREEFNLRGEGFSPGITMGKFDIDRIGWPHAAKAVECRPLIDSLAGNFLIKYGKLKYLKQIYDSGLVQLNPASFYEDSSLNSAIHDKERQLTIEVPPNRSVVYSLDSQSQEPKERLFPSRVFIKHSSKTDYYVYCLSKAYDIRMFHQFDADSCLIIKNPNEFIDKLTAAAEKVLSGYIQWDQKVSYIDPLHAVRKPDIFFSKHFRYAYQKEYRVLWLPNSPAQKLTTIIINLGHVSELMELIAF